MLTPCFADKTVLAVLRRKAKPQPHHLERKSSSCSLPVAGLTEQHYRKQSSALRSSECIRDLTHMGLLLLSVALRVPYQPQGSVQGQSSETSPAVHVDAGSSSSVMWYALQGAWCLQAPCRSRRRSETKLGAVVSTFRYQQRHETMDDKESCRRFIITRPLKLSKTLPKSSACRLTSVCQVSQSRRRHGRIGQGRYNIEDRAMQSLA